MRNTPLSVGTLDVDWSGIEKSSSDFRNKVARVSAQRSDNRKGSGFTRISTPNKLAFAGTGIGFASGAALAFYKKTGFWKGWGYAIVGAIIIGSLGRGVGFLTEKNN